jgi:uncharacterized protein (DUF433 family)
MGVEEYFEFRAEDEIRIKGTRIGIEIVLAEYLNGRTAEEIALNYPALSLEQIHASIAYYLHSRPAMESYLARWRAFGVEARAAQEKSLPSVVVRLREMATQRRSRLVARSGNPA